MILDREYEGVLGGVECIGEDGVLDDLLKENLGGQRPAVVDDGLAVLAIPTVHWKIDLINIKKGCPNRF